MIGHGNSIGLTTLLYPITAKYDAISIILPLPCFNLKHAFFFEKIINIGNKLFWGFSTQTAKIH
jgi:hypothetical protein